MTNATTETPKQEKSEPKIDLDIFQKVLMKDWGHKVPIGMPGMGDRSFTFRDYMLDQEEQIAEFKQGKRVTLGKFVMRVLSYMLTNCCGEDFTSIKEPGKMLKLSQMYMADVAYMYICLRMEGMGEKMDWDITCPFCRSQYGFEANLESMKLKTLEKPQDLIWAVSLFKGLKYQDEIYKELKMRSPNWGVFDASEFTGRINEATAAAAVLRGSILGVGEKQLPITENQLKKGLHKRDYEFLTKYVDERVGGPEFRLEFDCPQCRQEVKLMIPWMTPDFLSMVSSQPIQVRI